MIVVEVATTILGYLLYLFGSIKTVMIKLFYDHYAKLSEPVIVAATVILTVIGILGERSF